jgi:hypothetical protein
MSPFLCLKIRYKSYIINIDSSKGGWVRMVLGLCFGPLNHNYHKIPLNVVTSLTKILAKTCAIGTRVGTPKYI